MDTVENEEMLIAEVKARPSLYDKTSSDYKKALKKEKDWLAISIIVGADIEMCRKRWRSLRDSFAKQYRAIQSKGHRLNRKRKWAYYNALEFLIPHLEVREGKSYYVKDRSIAQESSDDVCSDVELELVDQQANHDEDPFSTVSNFDENLLAKAEPFRLVKCGKRKRRKCDTTDKKHSEVFSKEDADQHFLLSLLPFFRGMSPKRNAQTRIKVQQLLFKMAFTSEISNFSINSPEIVLCSPAYSADNSSRSHSPTFNNPT